MIKASKYIVLLFLLVPLSALDCVSREYSEFNNDSDLEELADSSPSLKQGYHKTFYSNGVIKEELYYKDGKLHGYIKEYDELGFLKEGRQYKDGVLNGAYRQYSKGKLTSELLYENGKIVRSNPTNKSIQNRSVSEQAEETVDLSSTDFKYLTYFLKLKSQVESIWMYPKESRYKREQGTVHVIFTLEKNGDLIEVKTTQSSGYPRLDNEAVRALYASAPYAPFPEHWGTLEKLNIRASFTYGYGDYIK